MSYSINEIKPLIHNIISFLEQDMAVEFNLDTKLELWSLIYDFLNQEESNNE